MPLNRWPGATVDGLRAGLAVRRGWPLKSSLMIAGAFGLAAWLTVASVSYLERRSLLEQAHEQIRTIQASYAELSSEADLLSTALLRQIEQLEERAARQEGTIAELTRTKAGLNHQLEAHARQLASLDKERERTQRLLDNLQQGVAEAEASRGAEAEASRGAVAEEQAELRERLRAAEARLADVSGQRDASRRAEIGLRWQLARLEDEVARLQSRGEVAQLWLEDWVLGSVEALEDLFVEAGIDVERMVARATSGPAAAQGGPLQVAGPDEIAATAAWPTDAPMSGNIHRLAALQRITRTLPLASPLDQFYVTSPHGKRRDPFTKTWAYHSGLDLGAPRNSAVLATAPGRVVVAGPSGPYGKMVEIDHGLGILTRYGHLQSIGVAVGDEVEFRQQLGVVGNTGRSTSRHLHYEILIDDRPFDPARFLNAGRLLVGVFEGPPVAVLGR
jgi:murein DD-endopeptidase MepM/ murein hydrolase activator NlpD